MTKRARRTDRRQAPTRTTRMADVGVLRQLLFPMVIGMAGTRRELDAFMHRMGVAALEEILDDDAVRIAGERGRHQAARSYHHWGRTRTSLPIGGRRVSLLRPRVRRRGGGEETLPTLARMRGTDPLPERVLDQIVLGVSTRNYERSLERPPPEAQVRGTSKSAASRHVVARTQAKLREQMQRRLDDVKLVALMLDGINVAEHTVVVALGVDALGVKVPLGLWLGSTENARLCTDLLQNLIDRGLRINDRILCVVDGGKGIRKALRDVFGDLAVVQRCQLHKIRNVKDHLPKNRQLYVGRAMADAYRSASADVARRRLKTLASWLDRNGHDEAAGSLREGLEETLTVQKLGIPHTLRRSFSTTNAIENLMGTVRNLTRNVRRWRGPTMVRRWVGLGVATAEQKFRRVKGHKDLPVLGRALRAYTVDSDKEAA